MNELLIPGLGLLAGVATTAYLYARWQRQPVEEPFQYFRCAQCNQKLRFKASKAGRPGMCPRCKQRWNLPAATATAARS
jgi:hypothetical protein